MNSYGNIFTIKIFYTKINIYETENIFFLHISKFYNSNCNFYFKQNNLYKGKKIKIKTKKEKRDFIFRNFIK